MNGRDHEILEKDPHPKRSAIVDQTAPNCNNLFGKFDLHENPPKPNQTA